MPTTTSSTTLLESVNIVLANLGESPVNSLTGGALPQQVSLALNTIEEVSTDIQSKGWWFNQQSGGNYDTTANVVIYPSNTGMDWGADIPEEARRYITIRASRIAQTRLIGSEELQKFSYNEELVSLAILQQAHVRNSNGVLDFNAFPAELRSLGMDEVMFLQGNVEEKIGTLRLGGELANIAKTKAETDLIADQEALVTQQALTEVQETTKRTREAELIDAQEALLQKQILTEAEQVAKVQEEVDLLQTQDALVVKQVLTEVKETEKREAEKDLILEQTKKVTAEELLVDAQELKTDAERELMESQKIQLDAQTAIEATAEKDFYDGVVAGTQNTYRDFAAEMRMMGIQETSFQSSPAYKKVELLKDAEKLRLVTATEETAATLEQVQVSGAGLEETNGTYIRNGTAEVDGVRGSYTKQSADGVMPVYHIWYSVNYWYITTADIGDDVAVTSIPSLTAYRSYNPAALPDLGSWQHITGAYIGIAPDPTVKWFAVSAGTDDPTELAEVNRIMRLIGEPPVLALNDHSLASECVRLLRDTNMELQGRGWWFNTSKDEDDQDVIAQKVLSECPRKYLEYLEVRVAILLTELYPQSGVDIQRLPKMEVELRAYFKDREFDDANYSIFDSYDVASRVGRNRNYSVI